MKEDKLSLLITLSVDTLITRIAPLRLRHFKFSENQEPHVLKGKLN